MEVTNIPTRYALIKRAEKILAEIDKYFEDAESFGVPLKDSDPDGLMLGIRKGIVAMLVNERRIKAAAIRTD